MNEKQKQVTKFLESLVHKRFSIESLKDILTEYFNEPIELEYANEEDDDVLTDYNLMFDSNNDETYGYFDIYVLKMRRKGFDGSDLYVTEVGYEFEI